MTIPTLTSRACDHCAGEAQIIDPDNGEVLCSRCWHSRLAVLFVEREGCRWVRNYLIASAVAGLVIAGAVTWGML